MWRQRLIGWSVVAACVAGLASTFNVDTFAWVEDKPVAPATEVLALPAGVIEPQRRRVEILAHYAGMLRPFERYQLGFEMAGRVQSLGATGPGQPIDVGSYVSRGQVLARLDDEIRRAGRDEAAAHRERAENDLKRADETRRRNAQALVEADYDNFKAEFLLADARLKRADKELRDAVLSAPATGIVSKRMINPGSNVGANVPVFELLEVDRLRLVVGVPESRIEDIRLGQTVEVELLGRDLFNRARDLRKGEVYRIGEAADDKTGLFEVEILLPNPDRRLRPGLVAKAHIVVERIDGLKLPLEALVVRGNLRGVFTVGADRKAHLHPLKSWSEQEAWLITPDPFPTDRLVVVRGQHRLVEGTPVAPEKTVLPTDDSDVPAVAGDVNTARSE